MKKAEGHLKEEIRRIAMQAMEESSRLEPQVGSSVSSSSIATASSNRTGISPAFQSSDPEAFSFASEPSSCRSASSRCFDDSSEELGYYGNYGPAVSDYPPVPPPLSIDASMTPERRARKQRVRPCSTRRGGQCHSDLLKSAVLATLESYESGEEEPLNTSAASMGVTLMDDNSRSSRKRARQTLHGGADEEEEEEEEESSVDDMLLGAMDVCSISSSNRMASSHAQPVRHVARRTSRELAYARRSSTEHR